MPPNPTRDTSPAGLLREAGAAARAGDTNEAERLYRRVLDQDPRNAAAWLGLGAVLTEPTRKADCFRRVLQLDPENQDAADSLERLRAVLPAAEPQLLACAFHPNVETVLRCSQCGRPICVRCANPFPVGQLCPVCVRGRRPLYYEASPIQLALVGLGTLGVAGVAGWLLAFVVGLGLFVMILAGLMVGSLLFRVALWVGQRRRGLAVQVTVAVCTVVGSLLGGGMLLGNNLFSLNFLVYVAAAAASVVAWLR